MITSKHYAMIETTGKDSKQMEVPVKFLSSVRSQNQNNFVISAGLAKTLGIDEQKELKILGVYRKVEEINLDTL